MIRRSENGGHVADDSPDVESRCGQAEYGYRGSCKKYFIRAMKIRMSDFSGEHRAMKIC